MEDNGKTNVMEPEMAAELPLLLFVSRSFRFRCLVDAREEILERECIHSRKFDDLLQQLQEEERKKAILLREFERLDNPIPVDELADAFKSLGMNASEIVTLTYQLGMEGFLSTSFEGDSDIPLFEHVTSDPRAIEPAYKPVNVITDGSACSGCGMCETVCPVGCISVNDGRVSIDMNTCIRCGICFTACPRSFLPKKALEWSTTGKHFTRNEIKIGHVLEAWSAKSLQEDVDAVKQDGGVTSTLLIHALDSGRVTSAIGAGTREGEPWNPVPVIMKTRKQVLEAAGTKYVNTPSLKLLGSLSTEPGIAIVGTPCMMQALWKGEKYPTHVLDLSNVKYKLGIFCMESFTYQGIKHLAEKILGTRLEDIRKMDINKGKFFMYPRDGEAFTAGMKNVGKLARLGCHCCYDLTSESADISIGSIGSKPGWNTVLIRNENGKELFDSAVAAGLLEKKPIPDVMPGLPLLKKLSFRKKRQYETTERKRDADNAFHPLYDLRLWPKPVKKKKVDT